MPCAVREGLTIAEVFMEIFIDFLLLFFFFRSFLLRRLILSCTRQQHLPHCESSGSGGYQSRGTFSCQGLSIKNWTPGSKYRFEFATLWANSIRNTDILCIDSFHFRNVIWLLSYQVVKTTEHFLTQASTVDKHFETNYLLLSETR